MTHPLRLKPFHVLECDNLEVIAKKVYEFVSQIDFTDSERPWNFIDTVGLVKSTPELTKWFNSMGLKLREAAITYIDSNIPSLASLPIHIDQLPVVAKINIPIHNTEGYLNRWYSISEEHFDNLDLTNNGVAIDKSQCTFLAEIDMSKPIVLNSSIPHEVVNTGTGCNPRIILSCVFFNEPIHFLEP